MILGAAPSASGQTTLGPCTYFPNPASGVFEGKILVDWLVAEAGDIVSAWDDRGHCAGAATVVMDDDSAYVTLAIYGDDPTTENLDEGMNPDERFYLRRPRTRWTGCSCAW